MTEPTPTVEPTRSATERWVLVVAMLLPSLITYIYFVVLATKPAGIQQVAGAGLKILQFGLPVLWVWMSRQRISMMLPTSKGLSNALCFGVASAVALALLHRPLLSALGVLDVAQQAVQQKVSELGFISRGKYLGLAAFYTVAHSLLEEYYWRWFVFGRLKKYVSPMVANIVSSVAFMGHHVIVLSRFFGIASPATWLCSLGVGLGGAVWAWMYHATDRLFPAWVSHAIIDAAIFYVGYGFLFP